MSTHRKLTTAELVTELRRRFGDDPMAYAFRCPNCDDVATGQDFRDALAENPRTGSDGECVLASQLLGQECIGRTLGALRDREGCEAAEQDAGDGLFRGPWEVVTPAGPSMWAFPIADTPIAATTGGS